MSANKWLELVEQNPGHSHRYIQRFRNLAAEGHDLDGEARFVDAMVRRRASILDAGCGPGRVGGRLVALGHDVVGVDIDAVLVDEARREHPGATWITADLATLDLSPDARRFDVAVVAGNVMAFLDPSTRRDVLNRLGAHVVDDGRVVVGFGAGRGYAFDEFFSDVESANLRIDLRLATWDLRPFTSDSEFLVAVLSRESVPEQSGETITDPGGSVSAQQRSMVSHTLTLDAESGRAPY